ncbi:hypothetical protein [Flavobacterium ginsengiterrae]|uniref:Uncharacterized protein n=1 Tax=Flavobacterium ginsengiterrae TaxID=871695 RepID=A0ABP7GZR4_9FLAO
MRILAKENAETLGSPPVSALGVSTLGTGGVSVFWTDSAGTGFDVG